MALTRSPRRKKTSAEKHALPDLICDTSVIQYLHQVQLLHLLPALGHKIFVPTAVAGELARGRSLGVDLPDLADINWLIIHQPQSHKALPLITDLGPGEIEVLMLALEWPESLAVLDDYLARRVASILNLQFTGTLGLLLDGKRIGVITKVGPVLEQLQALGFRLADHTRRAILKLAGE